MPIKPPRIRLALLNDYEVVVRGLRSMLEKHTERFAIVELDVNAGPSQRVDIALYDTFGRAQADGPGVGQLVRSGLADKVVVYSWNLDADLIRKAVDAGVRGYLSKRTTAAELTGNLERIHRGELVLAAPQPEIEPDGSDPTAVGFGDWPGRPMGLTQREADMIAMITQGLSNQEIASTAYLSINSVKSYIRQAYRKIDVDSRSKAVLWGIEHGFRPDASAQRRS